MNEGIRISIVVPCFNEEENLGILYTEIGKALVEDVNFEIIMVDDGSQDDTLGVIKRLRTKDSRVKYISFSRNFGHQFAIKAGIDHAAGNCVITMDADLQHPPELIPSLIDKWEEGYKIVNTKRNDNKKYSLSKKLTANLFYSIASWVSEVKIEEGVADFRLMDREVVNLISKINDKFLFLRGLLPWFGFKTTTISFDLQNRWSGKTKYTFRKMMGLAINGITSFSIKPLRLSMLVGLIFSILSFIYGLFAIYARIFTNTAIEGWTSVLVAILFIGGIQLIILGILGEYVGKIFVQMKDRQSYIVKEKQL